MINFLKRIWWWIDDLVANRPELGGRSSRWPKLRSEFFKENPLCALCGKPGEAIHHVIPVSVDPSKELEKSNLLTGCSSCHLKLFHLGSYHSFNKDIKQDARIWSEKILNRPK